MDRRQFVRVGVAAGLGLTAGRTGAGEAVTAAGVVDGHPRVISTHPFGAAANRIALDVFQAGGSALDAVEAGAMIIESDPDVDSVGLGGLPNSSGVVQLDAAIMDGTTLDAGAVAALENVLHPVAVARRVMETTPHVLLVGAGARGFALSHGFDKRSLLTARARQAFREWKRGRHPDSVGHDTIGVVARAADGTMAASCTTSGLAWKLPGRVGDSPLVGHGLYCDRSVGGAVATGIGEEIIKVCGSYQVVEFMRQGLAPDEAIRRVTERAVRRNPLNQEQMIAFVALRADGEVGYGSTTAGFKAAVSVGEDTRLVEAPRIVP